MHVLHRGPIGWGQTFPGPGLRHLRLDLTPLLPASAPPRRVVLIAGWLAAVTLLLILGLSMLLAPPLSGQAPTGPLPGGLPQVAPAAPR
ncbi:MAG: hypothetical protein JWP61_658 [Friedmanniella sp.]|nr:hypothetical protein [Friedmanniella sp.]